MSKEEDSVKDAERESFHFFGTKGKVKWVDFEKSIARHFRMKFGSIGEKLWMNELPIIEGDNAIDAQESRGLGDVYKRQDRRQEQDRYVRGILRKAAVKTTWVESLGQDSSMCWTDIENFNHSGKFDKNTFLTKLVVLFFDQ